MTAAALDKKYVVYARARRLSRTAVTYRHIFRNASAPFITMIGLNLGFVLSGSMVIENVFSIRGMGSLMYRAALARDFPVLQGCLVVSVLMVVAAGLAADMAAFLTDPRFCRAGMNRPDYRGRFSAGTSDEMPNGAANERYEQNG